MIPSPPKWADRFLRWYCNPALLEEIQGDAHELYFERLHAQGKRMADLKYIWDVLRFFRWSNIREDYDAFRPSKWRVLNLNWKVAARMANRNRWQYAIKTAGVAICVAFTLVLAAYVVQEASHDRFHEGFDRIYRITSRVHFHDHLTHYAVTPLPIGAAMVAGIPEVERYTRLMYEGQPPFRVDDNLFHTEVTLSADSNFLKMFSFEFVEGDERALDAPNVIVLTETTAQKFFGPMPAVGKQLYIGEHLLEVTGVISDIPTNSHLQFDALLSWDTFDHHDEWGNLNAYTYIALKPLAALSAAEQKMPPLLKTFHELVEREYQATYEPVFEPLADIHFNEPLDEDIAEKGSRTNMLVLTGVIALVLAMGIINYLSLSMAEVTANLKTIGIIRVFGGMSGSHRGLLFADSLVAILIVIPLSMLFAFAGVRLIASYGVSVDKVMLFSPWLLCLATVCFFAIIGISQFNATILSRSANAVHSINGLFRSKQRGGPLRSILVGVQFTSSILMIAMIFVISDQFSYIQNSDKGFEPRNVILLKLRDAHPGKLMPFMEEVKRLNGVSLVDRSTYAPLVIETKYVFQVESDQGMRQLLVPMMACGPDYLDALNVQLERGRNFDPARGEDQHAAFIINETAARAFGWTDPIGKKIAGPVGGSGELMNDGEVIGVVRDFNFESLHTAIEPVIIFLTPDMWSTNFVYVKTRPMAPPDLISSIKKLHDNIWTGVPFEWEYLDSTYQSLYAKDSQMKQVFQAGLIISVLIASLGIFSISALMATLRAKEMGIRKVVGANVLQLFLLHLKRFAVFLAACIAVACPLIYWISNRWLGNFAYRIELSPYHFLLPGLVAAFILLLTVGYHAARNARINPAETLKYE